MRLDPEGAITSINRRSVYSLEDYYDYKERQRQFARIAACEEAIRLDPENPDTYNSRGDIYFLEHDLDSAILDYTEAIRLAPEDARAYKNRGNTYYEKGSYDEAVKDYDKVIRLTPEDDSADLRKKRGDAYYQKGDYDQAIEDYNEAIRIDPIGVIFAYMKRGDAYSEKLNSVPTSEVRDEAVKTSLEVATTYHNEGYAYYREGKYEQAIASYNEAIRINPENAKVYVDRGDAYGKKCDIDVDAADYAEVLHTKDDIDMAIADYHEAIRCNPGDVIAYFKRGHAYLKKSDIELAAAAYDEVVNIDALNEAIRRNPRDATVYFSRGYMYSKQGSIDLAIADYDNAIRLCPNYETDFVNAGFVDGGEYAFIKIIELLENMIRTPAPENAADFYYCGLQALFSFSRTNAQEYFIKALNQGYEDRAKIERHLENARKLGNRDEEHGRRRRRGRGDISGRRQRRRRHRMRPALSKLNQWRRGTGIQQPTSGERHRYKETIANHNKTLQLNPKDAGAYNNRGYAYFQRGEYDKAIADYNKVIQLNPEDITAYFNKSRAYYQKGCLDLNIARHTKNKLECALLDETIRLNPKGTEAYINRGDHYKRRETYDMAIADYSEAIHLSPEYAKVYYSRAEAYYAIAREAYYELTQYNDAIVAYSKAITDYNEARRKGYGDYTDDNEFQRIFGSDYNSLVYAYLDRGTIYAKQGNYDLAITDMREAIIHDRGIKKTPAASFGSDPAARAYNNKGFYHYKKGEYDKAIEDLQEAVNIYAEQVIRNTNSTPDFATMYLNLGSAYHAMGDVELAIENYDNVIRLCPNYVTDFIDSNFAHGGKEEVNQATKLLDEIVEDPARSESFAAYYSGVSILFKDNRHKARRRFETALELGFDDYAKIEKHLANLR